MKTRMVIAACLLGTVCATPAAIGAVTVDIDLDPVAPNIQSTLGVMTGQIFTVDVVVTLETGDSLSSYGFGVSWDGVEVTGSGGTDTPPPSLPTNFEPGLPGGGATSAQMWDGSTTGDGPVGPTSFVAGTYTFMANVNGIDDGAGDITPGPPVPLALGGFFDNEGDLVTPVFNSGFLIPEPTSLGLLCFATLGMAMRRRVPRA